MTSTSPRWLQDVQRLLPIRSQFVLSGNIRDSFISPVGTGNALVPLTRCLWESVRQQGFQFLLIFDPADGLRVYPDEPAARDLATRLFDLKLCDGLQMISLESLSKLMRKLSQEREARCALVVDFASRLARQHEQLTEAEHRFFVAAEKISLQASPLVPQNTVGKPVYNPVIWLLNRAQDLPSWFTLDSERVASVVIARPDFETRRAAAGLLAPLFNGFASATPAAREQFLRSFTEGTEGMSLTALSDITELADRQQLDVTAIDDAVRCYKVGALDNPWRKDYLRDKIRSHRALSKNASKARSLLSLKLSIF